MTLHEHVVERDVCVSVEVSLYNYPNSNRFLDITPAVFSLQYQLLLVP